MVSEKALRDFEIYAKGVKRLEELGSELNSLDTSHFRKEVGAIRRKLKSVHLIPQIEHDLRELRAKISGIDLSYEKEKIDKKQSKRIVHLEKEAEVARKIPTLQHSMHLFKEKLENVKHLKQRKQLTKKEVKEVESIPKVKEKISYIGRLVRAGTDEIGKLKPEVERALRAAYRRQLTRGEIENVEAIPTLRGKMNYLRALLKQESEKLQELKQFEEKINLRVERALEGARKKQLTASEVRDVEAIPRLREKIKEKLPVLGRKISALKKFSEKEAGELEKIEERAERIPILQRSITALSKAFVDKSEDIAKEEGDIDRLKHRIYLLKKELEQKADELEKELQQKTRIPAKKKILDEIRELKEKIDINKEELYKKLREELSESKWMIEREKQELRGELGDIVAESKWLIEKQTQEINELLLNEIEKLNKKTELDKKETYDKLLPKLIQLKAKMDIISKEEPERLQPKTGQNEQEEIMPELIRKGTREPLFGELAQPFLPPPSFSEIKIKKSTPELQASKIKELPVAKIRFEFSELPELPELKLPKIKLPRFAPPEKMQMEYRLPEIPKEEFLRDVKAAAEHEKPKISSYKFTKELKSIERKTPLGKGALFLEIDNFNEADKNINDVEIKLHLFEQEIKNAVTESRQKKQMGVSELISEAEEIGFILSGINNKILKKIKI